MSKGRKPPDALAVYKGDEIIGTFDSYEQAAEFLGVKVSTLQHMGTPSYQRLKGTKRPRPRTRVERIYFVEEGENRMPERMSDKDRVLLSYIRSNKNSKTLASDLFTIIRNGMADGRYYSSIVLQNDPNDPRHGTYTGYIIGCRCDRCKAAGKAYRAKKGAR